MDAMFLDEHSVLNGLNFAEGEADGRRSTMPSGIPLFTDGALHQFVVPANSNAPVSLIARDNLVYELFFQLAQEDQPFTGVYNHFVYTTPDEAEQHPSPANDSANTQYRVEQSSSLYLPVAHESFRRFLSAQRASGVEQLPTFDETGAVHCLRINAPPACASLGDPQAVKAAFDLHNIARVEPPAADGAQNDVEQDARLEVTFRVSELGSAPRDKPLEVSYTVYIFDEEEAAIGCNSQQSLPLSYTRHCVVTDGHTIGAQQMDTMHDAGVDALLGQSDAADSDVQLQSDVVLRRIEALFQPISVNDSSLPDSLVECTVCHARLVDVAEYVRHFFEMHDGRRCPLCDVAFNTYEEVDPHLPRCAARAHAAAVNRLNTLAVLVKRSHSDATLKIEYETCALVEAHLAILLGSMPATTAATSSSSGFVGEPVLKANVGDDSIARANESVNIGDVEPEGADVEQDANDKQPELIAVQRGRGPIQIYGDFSCKFCGRLCKTYIGLKSHVTQGHREFYNKLLLHTLEKVKEIQLERVQADSVEAERLRMLDFDAAWNGDADLPQPFASAPSQAVPAGVNANALRWASASYAFFHDLTAEMLQLAFERVLRELENGVGVLNDEVRLEQMRSRVGPSAHAVHAQPNSAASVIEWRSSVNGEIKRIDERNKRSDAFVAYRKRIQQTNELIKMMERASQGDSNKRGLWNVLDVERLFQFVSGEQVQAASKLPSRYVRGKRPRGRPPKPETLGLPPNATAEQIQQAQLALHAERMRSTKQMRIIAGPLEVEPVDADDDAVSRSNSIDATRSRRNSKSASVSISCASAKNDDSLSDVNASESSATARAESTSEPVEVGVEADDAEANCSLYSEPDDTFIARCHLVNDGRYECVLCGAIATHRDSLLEHRRLAHMSKTKFVCDVDGCSKRFSSSQQLSEHSRSAHSTTLPYACTVCAAQFATRATFHRHVQLTRHENAEFAERQLHTCAQCSLSFRNEVFLRVHYNQVHKELPTRTQLSSTDVSSAMRRERDVATGPVASTNEPVRILASTSAEKGEDTDVIVAGKMDVTSVQSGSRAAQPIRVIRAKQGGVLNSGTNAIADGVSQPRLLNSQSHSHGGVSSHVAQKRPGMQAVNPSRRSASLINVSRTNADSDLVNAAQPQAPILSPTASASNASGKSVDAAASGNGNGNNSNPEVVYRCGLCQSLFPSLADVITHQQEFQVAQVRESRTKELDELRKREHELLSAGLIQQPALVGELAATRAQINTLEQELGAAQAVQYFCRMCHALFTSECLAQQHAREVHGNTHQPPTGFSGEDENSHSNTSGGEPNTPPDFAATFSGTLPGDTGLAHIE